MENVKYVTYAHAHIRCKPPLENTFPLHSRFTDSAYCLHVWNPFSRNSDRLCVKYVPLFTFIHFIFNFIIELWFSGFHASEMVLYSVIIYFINRVSIQSENHNLLSFICRFRAAVTAFPLFYFMMLRVKQTQARMKNGNEISSNNGR